MPTNTCRLFIAVSIPDSIKNGIETAQAELRRALPHAAIRWTHRDQFHLTLKFLGDVDTNRVPELTEAIRRTCERFHPLRLRAEGLGFFPDPRRPRVIWTAVRDEGDCLAEVQKAISAAVGDFTREKAEDHFAAHVTVGRVRSLPSGSATELAGMAGAMADRPFGTWTPRTVELLRSELTPTGARHTVLASLPLAGEG